MGRPAWNVRTMRAEMPARRRQLVAAAVRRCDWLAGRQMRSDWSPCTDKQSLKGVVWQVYRAQRQQRCCVSCMYYYKFPVVGNFVESCSLSVLRWAFFKLRLVTPFKTEPRLLWEVLINFWIYKRTGIPWQAGFLLFWDIQPALLESHCFSITLFKKCENNVLTKYKTRQIASNILDSRTFVEDLSTYYCRLILIHTKQQNVRTVLLEWSS